jgi:GTP-binding protein HflX
LHLARDAAPFGAMTTIARRTPSDRDCPPAVLVGVQLQGVSDEALASSLTELQRLAETLGLRVIGRVSQKRKGLGDANLLGSGKLAELAEYTGGPGIVARYAPPGSQAKREVASPENQAEASGTARQGLDEDSDADRGDGGDGFDDDGVDEAGNEDESKQAVTVLVDQDLSPTQMRNLEKATGVEVLDRSMVILSIFQRHARTREAKIQVEIARLIYMAPRLREANAGTERQRGGVGGKGVGESALELGRRASRDRIAELRRTLTVVQREADTQRSRRTSSDTHSVALVGYTNAGKSRLMRALTQDEMYVADQLFATLDTTVRVLMPKTRPRILISDTVGFIKDLPHDLVASFRSTLEEAKDASLHLHVLDAADPAFREQGEVTRQVLAEIGASDHPRLLVLNKSDLLDADQCAALGKEFPDAVLLSAHSAKDVSRLHGLIQDFFEESMEEEEFVIPYDQQAKVAMLHERCRVLDVRYAEDATHVRVRAPAPLLAEMRSEL